MKIVEIEFHYLTLLRLADVRTGYDTANKAISLEELTCLLAKQGQS